MKTIVHQDEDKTPVIDFAEMAQKYKEAYEQAASQLEVSNHSRIILSNRIVTALTKLSQLEEDLNPGSTERAAISFIISLLRHGRRRTEKSI